ncbi:LPS-assembly protein LptD [soil metagenome]
MVCLSVQAAWAQSPPPSQDGLKLKSSRELSPNNPTDESQLPTFFRGVNVSGIPERELVITGTGDDQGEVRRGGLVLRADHIRFRQAQDQLDADGAVRLQRDGGVYSGTSLVYQPDSGRGRLGGGNYQFPTGGRGDASYADFNGRDLLRFTEATYTTCRPGDESWLLSAAQIDIDNAEGTGVARDAVLRFMDVPILATPYMTFAVGDARKSGFLTPSFNVSTTRGLETSIPYYFNIAPNRDYTLETRLNGKRGVGFGNDFRYLGSTYSGETNIDWVPHDQAYGSSRWALSSLHTQTLGAGFGMYWNITRMSDDNYLADFSQNIIASANRLLTQEGGFTYARPFFQATLRVQKFQVLQDVADPITAPYERVPELTLRSFRYDVAGFDMSVDASVTKFDSPLENVVKGDRTVIVPQISYPIVAPGWFITPKAQLNAADYSLRESTIPAGSGYDPHYKRAIPTGSLDSGLVFERDSSFFGRNFLQTLEPRLFYVNTPYRKQSDSPVFDTAPADFNFAQLFNENTFAGGDRVSDANNLTAAVSTRLIDPGTGEEEFRALIGQRFYFRDQRVGLTSDVLNTSKHSDYLLGVGGRIAPGLFADSTVQYDAADSKVFKANLGVRWVYDRGRVASFNYRYIRDELAQYDLSSQWRLTDRWSAVGRVNYSTFENRLVEGLIGVEYQACCWAARFVAQKFVTATNTSNTTLFFQLQLLGLTSIGTNPIDALRRNVPGYELINQSQGPPSRYRNYE